MPHRKSIASKLDGWLQKSMPEEGGGATEGNSLHFQMGEGKTEILRGVLNISVLCRRSCEVRAYSALPLFLSRKERFLLLVFRLCGRAPPPRQFSCHELFSKPYLINRKISCAF